MKLLFESLSAMGYWWLQTEEPVACDDLYYPHDVYVLKELTMKFASAYYVAEPTVEIYIFVDESPSDLPENASLIIETKDQKELLSAVEPYFILGTGK